MFYRCVVDLVVVFLFPSETSMRKIRNKEASRLLLPCVLPSVVWWHSTSSHKYLHVCSMKHLCTVDFKIYLMLKYMHHFLLALRFSTAVTGSRCYCSCITNTLSSFICLAKNELKLWSSCNHPLCFVHFLFTLFIFSGLLLSWLVLQAVLFIPCAGTVVVW